MLVKATQIEKNLFVVSISVKMEVEQFLPVAVVEESIQRSLVIVKVAVHRQ